MMLFACPLVHAACTKTGQDKEKQKKKEVGMLFKLFITIGAIWAMGFFAYHFIRLLMGRRTF